MDIIAAIIIGAWFAFVFYGVYLWLRILGGKR